MKKQKLSYTWTVFMALVCSFIIIIIIIIIIMKNNATHTHTYLSLLFLTTYLLSPVCFPCSKWSTILVRSFSPQSLYNQFRINDHLTFSKHIHTHIYIYIYIYWSLSSGKISVLWILVSLSSHSIVIIFFYYYLV